MKILLSVLLTAIVLIFTGCAVHQPGYETPVVTITSFEAIPSQGVMPRFSIGLHIVNPNRSPLHLKGVSYTITLENHDVLTGVSNKLPQIEPYGEGDVVLNASIDLFNSIRLFNDLIRNKQGSSLDYAFKAKLDAGTLYPLIRVEKKGTFSLQEPDKIN
jgi:LEA14-like dessication related protein